jgi:hypothetical protein
VKIPCLTPRIHVGFSLILQVWTDLCKINLLNNPDINYCGNVAISTAVQELKKKKSVKQLSLLLTTFSLYPSDDEEEDDDHDDDRGGHPDESFMSPTTSMLPPTSFAFSPLRFGGRDGDGGRQERETPPFPTFAWTGTPPIASTSTPFSSYKNSNNSNMNGTNDMITD